MSNSVFGVATRAVAGFSRIGIMLLLASRYGPTLFGKVALAMSLMEVFRSFSEFGLDTIALRKFSQVQVPQHRFTLLRQVITSKLLAAGLFYVVSIVVAGLVTRERTEIELVLVASLSLFSANLVGALTTYYQSQFQMPRIFVRTLGVYATYVSVAFLAIFTHAPLLVIVAILPAAELLYFALLYRVEMKYAGFSYDVSATAALLKESLPLGIMSSMIFLYMRLDNIVVFKFLGDTALGLYATCFRMVEPALMVPVAFSTTLLVLLSTHSQEYKTRKQVLHVAIKALWPAYLFTFGAGLALILAGRTVLRHFNPAYEAAYPALRILALCLMIRSVNVVLTTIINSRGAYYMLTRITLTNLVVNIILVVILVPRLGITGAAWAAFGTELWNMVVLGRCLGKLTAVRGIPEYELISLEPECE